MSDFETLNAASSAGAGIGFGGGVGEGANATGRYAVECYDAEGNLKWTDEIKNLVTTAGKNFALDTLFSGATYTAAWYVGLMSSSSYTTGAAAGDTSASHGGWTEDQNYTQTARPTASFASASGGSKALSSAAAFSMNASTTIKGCFMISNSSKGGTTGTLYSAGLFTGGDKVLQNGDTLNVSYTASL